MQKNPILIVLRVIKQNGVNVASTPWQILSDLLGFIIIKKQVMFWEDSSQPQCQSYSFDFYDIVNLYEEADPPLILNSIEDVAAVNGNQIDADQQRPPDQEIDIQPPLSGEYFDISHEVSTQATPPQVILPPPQRPKKRQKEQLNHWTKNMLVFFKKPHQVWLEQFIKKHPELAHIKENQHVQRIFYKNKKHISMFDYECLYTIPLLAGCWTEMFCQHKYLFRHLMVGKADLKQKVVYRAKMRCFDKAFFQGKFEYIN